MPPNASQPEPYHGNMGSATSNQVPEMYYVLDVPGLYIKINFAKSPVRMAILQEDPEDTGEAPLYAVWDSAWIFPGAVTFPKKDVAGKAGLCVHNVLVVEEELDEGVTILSQLRIGLERRLHVYPKDVFYRTILDYTKENDAMREPALRYKMVPWQLLIPMKADQESEDEEVDVDEVDGVIPQIASSYLANEDVDSSSEAEQDQPFLSLVRYAYTGQWDRMLKHGPKSEREPEILALTSSSRVEISSFPKGFTIRMVNCGLSSKKKDPKTPVGDKKRTAIDDNTFHLLHPETDKLKHREYQNTRNRLGNLMESKKYPQWHDGIANHSQTVLEEFLNELKDLVTNAGGSWTDNRS